VAARRGVVADHEATEAAVGDPVHVERVLPDYSWPLHIPLEALRRMVALELAEAADLAAASFPSWRSSRP
jgi:hypothetical protein